MARLFHTRSQAAAHALATGMPFETICVDKSQSFYQWEERDDGPGIKYARLYARGKEWISHAEISLKRKPILIVTCTKAELPKDVPELFELRPITPSLWEKQAKAKPAAPKAPPAHDAEFRPDLKYVPLARLQIIFGKGGCI